MSSEELEPFIYNSIKLNDGDEIIIDNKNKLVRKSKRYVLSNKLIIRFQELKPDVKIKKIKRTHIINKLTNFEKIIYDYHPNRSNLSKYPLLILSRL